jgi:tRNA A37 threonylcarbamoyladenosine modification protein TsaB
MVYAQLFGDQTDETGAPRLMTPEQAAQALGQPLGQRSVVIAGSGAAAVASLAGPQAEACLPDLQPHARLLAMAASSLPPLEHVVPLYLRQPDAKPSSILSAVPP